MEVVSEARFWDVRLDLLVNRSVKQSDGSVKEYVAKQHKLVCVAAFTALDAIICVKEAFPDAIIWQCNNHGKECHILLDKKVIAQ